MEQRLHALPGAAEHLFDVLLRHFPLRLVIAAVDDVGDAVVDGARHPFFAGGGEVDEQAAEAPEVVARRPVEAVVGDGVEELDEVVVEAGPDGDDIKSCCRCVSHNVLDVHNAVASTEHLSAARFFASLRMTDHTPRWLAAYSSSVKLTASSMIPCGSSQYVAYWCGPYCGNSRGLCRISAPWATAHACASRTSAREATKKARCWRPMPWRE